MALTVIQPSGLNQTATYTVGNMTVTANANVGNLGTTGLITATGNITGGNIVTAGVITSTGNANVGNLGTTGLITATGNITGGNIITVGIVSATGNVSGNYFIGNGSQLTGVSAGASNASIRAQSMTMSIIFGG